MGFAVYLKHAFFNWPVLDKIPMAQPALIAFVFAAFLLMIRYAQDRGAIECGFFWLLVACFLALNSGDIGPASTIFFSTGGLVLITAVIETTYGRAYRDELTGLPGRRALSETLAKLGSRFTVAMVDIDRFKKFNDNFGHHVGDQVLRMIASKLENATGGGRAFRYGGEEFVMVFPGKPVNDAFSHLENLRKDIADSGFFLRGSDRRDEKPKGGQKGKSAKGKKKVTISIGVAERNEKNSTPGQVVKAADRALYRAKNKGRNKVSR
jgi:diguanylate cyclase (GGDEF)-like protein